MQFWLFKSSNYCRYTHLSLFVQPFPTVHVQNVRLQVALVFRLEPAPFAFVHGHLVGTPVQQHVCLQVPLGLGLEIAFRTVVHWYFIFGPVETDGGYCRNDHFSVNRLTAMPK